MILTINSKIIMPKPNTWADGVIFPPGPDPYNPLGLPPNTMRVRTSDGNPPQAPAASGHTPSYERATLVPGTTDVYDVYRSGTSFGFLLDYCFNVVEVLGANTTGITRMPYMFMDCRFLTSVPLFDTSSVTDMSGVFAECYHVTSVPLYNTSNVTDMADMFARCTRLTTIPLLDTSKVTKAEYMFSESGITTVPLLNTSNVTNMNAMFFDCHSLTSVPLLNTSKVTNMNSTFSGCYNVESGALALYQQASSQANPPSAPNAAFYECGRDTVTGAAELAQIPSSWGGTGA